MFPRKHVVVSDADGVLYCESDRSVETSCPLIRRSSHTAIAQKKDTPVHSMKGRFSLSGRPHELAALRQANTGGSVGVISDGEEKPGSHRERSRRSDSLPSKDNDTPHLYMDTQSLQGSYAAQHLRSMRIPSAVSSSHVSLIEFDRNFEQDFLQDISVSSIEVRRDRDTSMASPALSKASLSLEQSPSERRSFSGMQKKRPFTAVDTSPFKWGPAVGSHTGMTMEFEAVTIGDENRRKRSLQMDVEQSSSPMLRGSKVWGFRNKLHFDPCRTSSKADLSTGLSSTYGSSIDVSQTRRDSTSLAYQASVSSIGSDPGVFLGLSSTTGGSALWRKSVGGFSFSSSLGGTHGKPYLLEGVVLSTTSQRGTTDVRDTTASGQLCQGTAGQCDQSSGHPDGQLDSAANCSTSSELVQCPVTSAELAPTTCSAIFIPMKEAENRHLSLIQSEGDHRNTGSTFPEISKISLPHSSDFDSVEQLVTSSDSDAIAAPLPMSPDGEAGFKPTWHDPFKTPSPAKDFLPPLTPSQKGTSSTPRSVHMQTPPSQSRSHTVTSAVCRNVLLSSKTDTSPMHVISDVQSPSMEADVDTSLHNMSLDDKASDTLDSPRSNIHKLTSISPPCRDEFEKTKECSISHGSSAATTTSTITPGARNMVFDPHSHHLDMSAERSRRISATHSELEISQAPPSNDCELKVQNKLLKKVTTFISLPASSGATDTDNSLGSYTPLTASQKRFMVGNN